MRSHFLPLPLLLPFAAVLLTAATAAADPPPVAPPAAADPPHSTTIRVTTPDLHVRLFGEPTPAELGRGVFWPTVVCGGSCNEEADTSAGRRFYFDGPGMVPSRRFRLDGSAGDVHIEVKPGNMYQLVSGASVIAGGAVLLTLATVQATQAAADHTLGSATGNVAVVSLLGAASIVGGGLLVYFNTTRVGSAPSRQLERNVGSAIVLGLARGGRFSF